VTTFLAMPRHDFIIVEHVLGRTFSLHLHFAELLSSPHKVSCYRLLSAEWNLPVLFVIIALSEIKTSGEEIEVPQQFS
jgi:hypothetical protein